MIIYLNRNIPRQIHYTLDKKENNLAGFNT